MDLTWYEIIKYHKIIAVDLSKQNKLYVDSGRIQQIELLGQLKLLMVQILIAHNPCLF